MSLLTFEETAWHDSLHRFLPRICKRKVYLAIQGMPKPWQEKKKNPFWICGIAIRHFLSSHFQNASRHLIRAPEAYPQLCHTPCLKRHPLRSNTRRKDVLPMATAHFQSTGASFKQAPQAVGNTRSHATANNFVASFREPFLQGKLWALLRSWVAQRCYRPASSTGAGPALWHNFSPSGAAENPGGMSSRWKLG